MSSAAAGLWFGLGGGALLALVLWAVQWQRQLGLKREAFIREAQLPRGLYDALRKRRPELSLKDCQLVGNGLRQFFLAHLKSGRRYVSMPSQVVDDLWHEFILYTKNYEHFCQKAFGRFLHHSPAAVLSGQSQQANAGLRRCWWYACLEDHVNPRKATRLPLLFALDSKLNIANGFHYTLDCDAARRARSLQGAAAGAMVIYCGGDFASDSFDGSTDGFGDSAISASASSSCGGGSDGSSSGDGGSSCGGGSCGGGGCGGGGD